MAHSRAWFFAVCATFTSACGNMQAPSIGTVDIDDQADIINGHPSKKSDYPATGALLIRGTNKRGKPQSATCTATLIAPDVVLTAAHCVEENPGDSMQYYFSLAMNVMRAGSLSKSMPSHTYKVRQVVSHPDYFISNDGGLGQSNDLAIAFLKKRVTEVAPARMLAPDEAAAIAVDAPVDIVGYGVRGVPDEEDGGLENDEQAGVKSTARSSISEVGTYELQIGHGLPEPEKCFGDSGGPSYIRTAEGTRLIGITSHTYDADAFAKGTVDERVDAMSDWINDTLGAGPSR